MIRILVELKFKTFGCREAFCTLNLTNVGYHDRMVGSNYAATSYDLGLLDLSFADFANFVDNVVSELPQRVIRTDW